MRISLHMIGMCYNDAFDIVSIWNTINNDWSIMINDHWEWSRMRFNANDFGKSASFFIKTKSRLLMNWVNKFWMDWLTHLGSVWDSEWLRRHEIFNVFQRWRRTELCSNFAFPCWLETKWTDWIFRISWAANDLQERRSEGCFGINVTKKGDQIVSIDDQLVGSTFESSPPTWLWIDCPKIRSN